jgi:type IX secretion system PorP/SprF family membrane protein
MKMHVCKPAVLWIAALLLVQLPAAAQHTSDNAISQYYRDGYLWNPALAGMEGTRFYGLYNSSWTGFEGSSNQADLAADLKTGKNMGAGIHLTSASAGVLNQYGGALSYSYRLPFTETSSVGIGGELSFFKEHLDAKELASGNEVDPVVSSFNEKSVRFNGDLGADLRLSAFELGATAYNLGAYFKSAKDRESDLEMLQVVSSYRFGFSNEKLSLTPLVAYKMYSAADNIFLVAAQFQYDKAFHTSLYWESTGSVMGGLGFLIADKAEINFFYATKNRYGYHDQFEVGLKLKLK